jgi:hypothetical protein
MLNAKIMSIDFVSWDWKVEKKALLSERKKKSRCELIYSNKISWRDERLWNLSTCDYFWREV